MKETAIELHLYGSALCVFADPTASSRTASTSKQSARATTENNDRALTFVERIGHICQALKVSYYSRDTYFV
jgi:hypothetical protein